jgi:hypothetical protein
MRFIGDRNAVENALQGVEFGRSASSPTLRPSEGTGPFNGLLAW